MIFVTFLLFMHVEKYSDLDHKAIVIDQKAAALAEGREYVSAIDKIRIEEGEEAYQKELKKQEDAAAKAEAKLMKLSPEKKAAKDEAEKKLLAEFN